MNKIHILREFPKYRHEEAVTICGKRGVADRISDSEYITMDGREDRFEVVTPTNHETPTCKRCILVRLT